MDVYVVIYKMLDDNDEDIIYTIDVDNAKTFEPALEIEETFNTYEEAETYLNEKIKPQFHVKEMKMVDYTKIITE